MKQVSVHVNHAHSLQEHTCRKFIIVTGKRGNVDVNNSPQRELNRRPLDLKSSTLPNDLKGYPTSTVLVVVLINPNHYISMQLLSSSGT